MATSTKQRVAWTVALVLWLCVVWGHSLVPADESLRESSRFVVLLQTLVGRYVSLDEHLATFIVRKTAHFSEYLALMVIASKWAQSWWDRERSRLATIAVWVLVPIIDEIIQHFVPGRDMRLMDVCIDMAGGLVGMALVHGIASLRKR